MIAPLLSHNWVFCYLSQVLIDSEEVKKSGWISKVIGLSGELEVNGEVQKDL
jgi:hypothetical protein